MGPMAYMLRNCYSEYTSQVAQKITKQCKWLGFRMGESTFTGDDPIVIIDLLQKVLDGLRPELFFRMRRNVFFSSLLEEAGGFPAPQ